MDILEVYLTLSDIAAKQGIELTAQELYDTTYEIVKELYNIEEVDEVDLVVKGYGQNLINDQTYRRRVYAGDSRSGVIHVHTRNNSYSTLITATNIPRIIQITKSRLKKHLYYNKLMQCAYIYWTEQRGEPLLFDIVDVCPEYLLYDIKMYYNNKLKDSLTHISKGGNEKTIIPERYKNIFNRLYGGDKK